MAADETPGAAAQLPAGAVLVHIGPYKTGSTAIQTTLALHRDELARHDVLYPGDGHRQMRPTWALIRRTASGVAAVPMAEWDALASQVRAAPDSRVVISSEDLASAKPDQVRRLADDLGPDRVHVLIVVRRLDKLFPSSWQERVKSWNETRTYAEWLREVLDPARSTHPAQAFWRNHGLQSLLGVWAHTVPRERIVLLVADEADRTRTASTLEQLLGLPGGLLTPGPRENSSLTFDKVELYRRVNQLFKEQGWSDRQRRELVYRGLLHTLRQVEPHEADVAIPRLPPWSEERVRELNRVRAEQVASHPGLVVGDPGLLTGLDVASPEDWAELPQRVPVEAAVAAVEGVVDGGRRLRRQDRRRDRRQDRQRRRTAHGAEGSTGLADLPLGDLVRALAPRRRGSG